MGLKQDDALLLVNETAAGNYDWDALMYVLKHYSLKDGVLALRSYKRIHWSQSNHVSLSMTELLELVRVLRERDIPWGLFLHLTVRMMDTAGIRSSFSMPLPQLLLVSKAIQEGRLKSEYLLKFFDTNTYWPDNGEVLDFGRWFAVSQVIHWYSKSLFGQTPRRTEFEEQSDELNVALFRQLTGKRIDASLILRFASGELKLEKYLQVFKDSVVKPQKNFLGWPWRKKYFGDAPFKDYESYIEDTHARALAAAKSD